MLIDFKKYNWSESTLEILKSDLFAAVVCCYEDMLECLNIVFQERASINDEAYRNYLTESSITLQDNIVNRDFGFWNSVGSFFGNFKYIALIGAAIVLLLLLK